MPRVLVALPTYDDKGSARAYLSVYGARLDNLSLDVKTRQLSALCWNFNLFYVDALNNKTYDYFLLMHADIIPLSPQRWVSKLITEAETAKADLISVLSPIKNQDGLTSTALESDEHSERRLSMRESILLPQTFKADDLAKVYGWDGDTNKRLLINTGCMLMDLRRNRDKWESMWFKTVDRVEKQGNKFVATFIPEDWDFSRQAHAQGLTVAATRAISLVHNGSIDYRNDESWGTLDHDERPEINGAKV